MPGAGDASATGGKSGRPVVHVVRRGETLQQIAQRYGAPVSQIAKLNGIKDASLIRVGDELVISGNPNAIKKKKVRAKKKFVVDISEQRCWRYMGDKLLDTWRCSTGRNNSTKTGRFRVQSKLRKAYGSTWNIWMPWWLGIYWSGPVENGIHGLPWDAKTGGRTWAGLVGTPITFGCVMLNDKHAETLWKWADIGTTVIIKR
jgi:LysM repeat protein